MRPDPEDKPRHLRGGRLHRIRIIPVRPDGMPGHQQEPITFPDAELPAAPAVVDGAGGRAAGWDAAC
jgi:hypothetical protein